MTQSLDTNGIDNISPKDRSCERIEFLYWMEWEQRTLGSWRCGAFSGVSRASLTFAGLCLFSVAKHIA